VTDLVLDPARSRVRIHTFAEGILARLAHDLELVCGNLEGTALHEGSNGAAKGNASIAVPLSGCEVGGILGKDGRVDDQGLSPSERRDVIAKMQKDVFHCGPDGVVRVEGHLDAGKARLRLIPPNGKGTEAVVAVEVRAEPGGGVRATGSFEVALSALGSSVIKGPMGAFRVKDRVKVSFDLGFTPRG